MDLAELERKLIATARANRPSEAVPYAFEKRVLAHLAARPIADRWAQWSQALWRAAVSCVVVMLLMGAWSFYPGPSGSTGDLAQEFENTLFAAADQDATAEAAW